MKLGRNEKCWCGSGIKFKKCHLNRESQPEVSIGDAIRLSKALYAAKVCSTPKVMHSECSGKIVRAHTLPKSGSLSEIALNGHVYSFSGNVVDIRKNLGLLVPSLTGINLASTFTGFCSKHDDSLFSVIEKEFFLGRPDQCFFLAYRSYAREIYLKKAFASQSKDRKLFDRGKSISTQIQLQAFYSALEVGGLAALKDIEYYQARHEAMLLSRNFSAVRAYVITFETAPPVMCSGSFAPEQDFNGAELQDVADLSSTPKLIHFTSFFGGVNGHAVFVWLLEDDMICLPFVQTLASLPDADVSSALVRFMFETFENTHMNPQWWDELSKQHRDALIQRMSKSANPNLERELGCLVPDGWVVSPWTVNSREWIGVNNESP